MICRHVSKSTNSAPMLQGTFCSASAQEAVSALLSGPRSIHAEGGKEIGRDFQELGEGQVSFGSVPPMQTE